MQRQFKVELSRRPAWPYLLFALRVWWHGFDLMLPGMRLVVLYTRNRDNPDPR